MNFKVSTGGLKEKSAKSGIVYVLELDILDVKVVKIGVTTRRIEERVVEILTSAFHKYRRFLYCYPKRYKTTSMPYEKEAMLHRYFADRRYTPEHVFSGCTELFAVGLDEVVEVYERVLKGEDVCESAVSGN